MDTNFELDADQQKIKSQIFPYLKSLTYEILMKKPDNIASFMIDFLSRQGNYTTSGLTFSEKKELENLRTIVKRYRELETFNKTQEENSDSEDDNEDLMNSSDEEKIENQVKIMKNNPKSQFKKIQEIVLVLKYTVFSIRKKFLFQKKFIKPRNK